MKDKNSKSYKQARRQKAIAFGRKASALHKKRKAEEYALLLKMQAQHQTPKGKGMRIKRRDAMMVLEDLKQNGNVMDTKAGCELLFGEHGPACVDFVLKAKDQILATPHIHSYEFEVTRG